MSLKEAVARKPQIKLAWDRLKSLSALSLPILPLLQEPSLIPVPLLVFSVRVIILYHDGHHSHCILCGCCLWCLYLFHIALRSNLDHL